VSKLNLVSCDSPPCGGDEGWAVQMLLQSWGSRIWVLL